MYNKAKFDTSVTQLESVKQQIMSEMCFEGFEAVEERIDTICSGLNTKNAQMQQLYDMFDDVQDEMSRIYELMQQDPENQDTGIAYVKRI